jgi:hypothetical protein
MSIRTLSPFVLVLVSIASFAGAQTSAPAAFGIDTPAFSTLAESQPVCDTQAKVPTDQPTPMFLASGPTCGNCSSVACRGASPGAVCGVSGGKVYTCQDTDLVCSSPSGSPKCACLSSPL